MLETKTLVLLRLFLICANESGEQIAEEINENELEVVGDCRNRS